LAIQASWISNLQSPLPLQIKFSRILVIIIPFPVVVQQALKECCTICEGFGAGLLTGCTIPPMVMRKVPATLPLGLALEFWGAAGLPANRPNMVKKGFILENADGG
jgi:hypothetical protein